MIYSVISNEFYDEINLLGIYWEIELEFSFVNEGYPSFEYKLLFKI